MTLYMLEMVMPPSFFQVDGDQIFNHLWSPCINLNENFPKTYYMPTFQIQSIVIEKSWSPYNDLNFLDSDLNLFLVAICMVPKRFDHK